MKVKAALASLSLAVSFVSCQHVKSVIRELDPTDDLITQDLSDEVTELQSMRQELSAAWDDIDGRVTAVESDINQFSPSAPAVAGVDLSPVADDILAGAAIQAAEAGSVKGTANGLEGIYGSASDETRAEITRVQTEGHRIMSELNEGLPSSLQELVTSAATASTNAILIQQKAEHMAPAADKNVLMTDDQKATYQSDMMTVDAEVAKLSELASKISQESGGMSDRLGRATANFQAKVGAFGAGR